VKSPEVAVVAMPDDKWMERPMAIVVPYPNETIAAEQLDQLHKAVLDTVSPRRVV